MENVKEEFATWLLNNAPESYNQFLGRTIQSVVERLNEIQNFFSVIDLFNTDKNNYSNLIDKISVKLKKKERLKNPEFIKYDKFHSNGIPKAIIGTNNYMKFLTEKFGTQNSVNYWVFQGSPKIYDMVGALESNVIKTWTVSAHKDKIKVGDKFILWLTGNN